MPLTETDGLRTRSPYPERSDVKLNALDFALTELFANISVRFGQSAGSLTSLQPLVDKWAPLLSSISDAHITDTALKIRGPLLGRGFQADLVALAFALVREATYRKLKIRHYPVQLQGAWALLNGKFIEMATGEGKTLTALLAAVAAALAGKPVHVITVNDYLAARDADELRPVYELLGLTVGVVQHGQDAAARRSAYACDVTYAVNKEIAFDYLRDGIALGTQRTYTKRIISQLTLDETPPLLLRGLSFAIIDEADSVLIDEARTPLIISGLDNDPEHSAVYTRALNLARQLRSNADFVISPNGRSVEITPEGSKRSKTLTGGWGGIWEARKAREELISQAVSALHLYKIDQHYVVVDGKVQIIDEFTGRIAEGRSWQHGLHQLIEAKENCEISQRQQTMTSITYQRFFRRYLHLCGMSGTLLEVAAELKAVYGASVIRIPTNKPNQRIPRGLRVFYTSNRKWAAVTETVELYQKLQRPVLIGTRSIATSELLSGLLKNAGIDHVVLNAHHDRQEASIIAQAGQCGRVTVATNMAGRGTDIKLGPGVDALGGLHVVLTEFHEAGRIDRQLIGRCGRQGEPGSFEIIASLEDELTSVFSPRFKALLDYYGMRAKHNLLPEKLARTVRWYAQSRAERLHYRIRRQTLKLQDQQDSALAFAGPE